MRTRLWISGEIQGDVYDAHRATRKDIEEAVNRVLENSDYGDGLVEWDHIPIILSFEDPDYHEIKRYRRKKREVEFRLKIPHAAFKAANPVTQRKLFMDMILRSVDEMRSMKIPNFDLQKLESDMRELAAAKGWD